MPARDPAGSIGGVDLGETKLGAAFEPAGDSAAREGILRRELCLVMAAAAARGWCRATSGNFSVRLSADPLLLLGTPSGADKGSVRPEDLLVFDRDGAALRQARGRPSAEARLHATIAETTGAAAILHTHSVPATLLSEHFCARGSLTLQGYEMEKSLAGITTHEAVVELPIFPNTQDIPDLAARLRPRLRSTAPCPGFLLAGHGLYAWGADLETAWRHLDGLEFLLEVIARRTPFAPYPS